MTCTYVGRDGHRCAVQTDGHDGPHVTPCDCHRQLGNVQTSLRDLRDYLQQRTVPAPTQVREAWAKAERTLQLAEVRR